jgi:aldose sugar dehydrogenase
MSRLFLLATAVPIVLAGYAAVAQPGTPRAAKRNIAEVYSQNCASCHGPKLQGGSAPSMLDDTWAYGGDDASLAKSIRDGIPDKGMPPWKAALNEAEIRAMVVFIREQRVSYTRGRHSLPAPAAETVLQSQEHSFRIETVATDLDSPWSMAFLPDGRMLVAEKSGALRVVEKDQLLPDPVAGTPKVHSSGQAGLMEIALHPKYAENGWIYLAYSDPQRNTAGRTISLTTIVRGKIEKGAWIDQQTIWKAPPELYLTGDLHYGCRIAFDREGYLYFTHGERGRGEHAQDLSRPNGKVHRIHDDGRIPEDNPFVDRAVAFKSIWTYGNRNPQGLDFDPRTGLLWETEHGPRGGDELNRIRRGVNYGWPVITYGMDYDGTPISDKTAHPGMEQPVIHWTPSIAVCGIDFYEGDAFPKWKGNLFVTALAQQELRRVAIDGEKVTHQEVILKDLGRLRDVASGPDGAIYVAVNNPGRIVRLVPARK